MKNFTYYRPTTPEQAVGLLDSQWGTTELLGGGTDLLDLQKEYIAQPDKVISLGAVKGLTGIKTEGGRVVIGAGTKLAEIAEHTEIRKAFPALAEAAGLIGGPQIRNMGTLGGNLCQRNRCWYFRDEHVHCLLKGGKKCYATDGDNRYHAVFTQGHPCVIVNPSTLAPVLIALGAVAEVLGPKGKRTIELAKFFHAPSKASEREHVLAPNELVLAVSIPSQGLKNASYEVRHKQSYDWPLVQAAVAFNLDGGKARDVKVVLGHVAPTPLVADAAAKGLEGQTITEGTAVEAGVAAARGAKPLSHNAYKVKLIEVAVKRALLTAAGQKKYWEV
ncbi:MAG TPA: xanthine dehydrogenase family protein subunit M [Gemmataceae bacterium]|nr:xanthine dehydrogenase family protein subunit M [Gemmataceae bacterium]